MSNLSPQEVIEEFAKRKSRILNATIGLIAFLLLIPLLLWLTGFDFQAELDANVAIGAAAAVFAVILPAVVFMHQQWHCPACRQHLGEFPILYYGTEKFRWPDNCSKCGCALK